LAQRRPTRSSAVDFRDRWYFSSERRVSVGKECSDKIIRTVDSLVGGLAVGRALGSRSLPATTAHADAVHNVALLGLVAETAGFLWEVVS